MIQFFKIITSKHTIKFTTKQTGPWYPSFKCGEESGTELGRPPGMKKFTFDSAVWGYHIYKVVWKPTIGEKLQNEANKFAVKVVKNNE